MKHSHFKILFLIIMLLSVFSNTLKAQYFPYDQQKATKFYEIFPTIVFAGDEIKTNYNFGLYGCSDSLIMYLKKQKPSKFFSGKNIEITKFNPFTDDILKYDVVIIGESKNKELNDIYNIVLKAAKNGASIAMFTNNWQDKEKISFNFFIENSKQFVKFEYNSVAVYRFNISLDNSIKNLGGIDLNMQKLLDQTQQNLEQAQVNLKQKEKELDKIISDLEEQKKKINVQKSQIDQQQKLIEQKQLEIKQQQSKLQNILVQMQETQSNLDIQRQNIIKKDQELKEKQQALFDFQNKMQEFQRMFESQKRATEEKIAQIKEITLQIEAKKKELGNLNNIIKLQRYALWIFSLLLAVILLLAVWIFRNYRKMKLQNVVLEQQKNEIGAQAVELEKINIELEKLSIVASQTNNAVSILDEKGRFSWVNSGFTKLYGYTLQLLENEIDSNIKKSDLYTGINETFDSVVVEKKSEYFEHKSITRDGKSLWVQSSITPIMDYKNNVKRVVLVDSNISELKEAEQQIAEQNKNIKKSILYASRIQNATLPSVRILENLLSQSFILYLPRDIVSGDFYWATEVDEKIFFAAADCTGHGVPGAFMSMLGITLLNEIVSKENKEILRPDYILNQLRIKLIHALSQDEEETKSSDGIAIAMCMLDKINKKLHFSGAENQMILVRDNSLYDYIADDMPIGISEKPTGDFTNQVINYQSGDMIYLFSDGYVDQFGGPGARVKKFLIVRLRELFLKINTLNPAEQQKVLLQNYIEWKGKNKQIDDIIVMGVRL